MKRTNKSIKNDEIHTALKFGKTAEARLVLTKLVIRKSKRWPFAVFVLYYIKLSDIYGWRSKYKDIEEVKPQKN